MKKEVDSGPFTGADRNAKARAKKKMAMKMLNMPFWAYTVQIFTTSFEFSVEAERLAASSSLMCSLMYWTAR